MDVCPSTTWVLGTFAALVPTARAARVTREQAAVASASAAHPSLRGAIAAKASLENLDIQLLLSLSGH
jgi:hypothetical protein